jgi:hypothetical protein
LGLAAYSTSCGINVDRDMQTRLPLDEPESRHSGTNGLAKNLEGGETETFWKMRHVKRHASLMTSCTPYGGPLGLPEDGSRLRRAKTLLDGWMLRTFKTDRAGISCLVEASNPVH